MPRMDKQGILASVILVALVGLVIGFLAFLESQKDTKPFIAYSCLIGILVVIVLYKSIWFIGPDQSLDVFLIGTHRATFANGSLRDSLGGNNGDINPQQVRYDALQIQKGLGGFDVVFALWPIWRVYRFSTTGGEVLLHASNIYTRSGTKTSRVMLEADPNLNLRFFTLRWFIKAIRTKMPGLDLTETSIVHEGDEEHSYEDTLLSNILTKELEAIILEAVRKAAAFYTWEGTDDIIVNKKGLEMATLFELAEPGSILEQAKIFIRPDDVANLVSTQKNFLSELKRLATGGPTDFYGPSIISGDFNIEQLRFARKEEGASEAELRLNDPLLGVLEGERLSNAADGEAAAIRKRGFATAKAERTRRDALGVPGEVILITDKLGEVKITSIGDTIIDAVTKTFKKP